MTLLLYSTARAHMEEKYQWAEESLSIIRHEGSDYGPHDGDEPGGAHGTDLKKLNVRPVGLPDRLPTNSVLPRQMAKGEWDYQPSKQVR